MNPDPLYAGSPHFAPPSSFERSPSAAGQEKQFRTHYPVRHHIYRDYSHCESCRYRGCSAVNERILGWAIKMLVVYMCIKCISEIAWIRF